MKVGLLLPGTHPYEGNEAALGLATSLDFDSVWIADHLLGGFHPELFGELSLGPAAGDPDAYFDPFCLAATLGRQTEVPLGISVTDATRRGAPDVARTVLTLQQICTGGFNLGVGSGEAENLVPFGYPMDKPVGRTEEFLRLLRHLVDTGRMPHGVGRIGLPLESDRGKPRVWVAGHGPRMLRLTGQYGDGWLPAWPMSPQEYGEKRDAINRHAAEAGRSRPEPGLLVCCLLGTSRDEVAEAIERQPPAKLVAISTSAEIWRRHGLEHPFGDEAPGFNSIPHQVAPEVLRDLANKIPFELVEEQHWAGNPEELAARAEGYARHGCEHFVLINNTGLVGGPAAFEKHISDLASLRKVLGAL